MYFIAKIVWFKQKLLKDRVIDVIRNWSSAISIAVRHNILFLQHVLLSIVRYIKFHCVCCAVGIKHVCELDTFCYFCCAFGIAAVVNFDSNIIVSRYCLKFFVNKIFSCCIFSFVFIFFIFSNFLYTTVLDSSSELSPSSCVLPFSSSSSLCFYFILSFHVVFSLFIFFSFSTASIFPFSILFSSKSFWYLVFINVKSLVLCTCVLPCLFYLNH